MTKNEIITFVVKKFDEMSKTQSELLISVFTYLNPELETVIHNRHDLACHLADNGILIILLRKKLKLNGINFMTITMMSMGCSMKMKMVT